MTDTAGAWVSDMVGGLVSAGNPLLRDLWLASPADQGMTEGRGHEELVEAAAVAEENDPKRLTALASGFVESVVEGLVVEGETVEMGDETSSSAGGGVVSEGGSSAAVDAAGVDGAQEKWGDWFYFNDASVSRVSWRQQPGGAAPPGEEPQAQGNVWGTVADMLRLASGLPAVAGVGAGVWAGAGASSAANCTNASAYMLVYRQRRAGDGAHAHAVPADGGQACVKPPAAAPEDCMAMVREENRQALKLAQLMEVQQRIVKVRAWATCAPCPAGSAGDVDEGSCIELEVRFLFL